MCVLAQMETKFHIAVLERRGVVAVLRILEGIIEMELKE
jgi:hypothetical protein